MSALPPLCIRLIWLPKMILSTAERNKSRFVSLSCAAGRHRVRFLPAAPSLSGKKAACFPFTARAGNGAELDKLPKDAIVVSPRGFVPSEDFRRLRGRAGTAQSVMPGSLRRNI